MALWIGGGVALLYTRHFSGSCFAQELAMQVQAQTHARATTHTHIYTYSLYTMRAFAARVSEIGRLG